MRPALFDSRAWVALEAGQVLAASEDGELLSIGRVLEAVAAIADVSTAQLVSYDRRRRVCNARQVAMYLLRELFPLSLPQIGALFGGRDHTTVLHAVRVVCRDLDYAAV